jgi:glycosidase
MSLFLSRFRVMLCLSVLAALQPALAQVTAQTTAITFRLADPQKQYIRAFVPGEFNNWGPNSNGRISAGAPSEMSYDASSGAWTKTLQLPTNRRYLYKFHIHRNADGSQYEWFPDPLNPLQDGTPNQNSVLVTASLLVSQPALDSAQGVVRGVSAVISGASPLVQLAIVVENTSTALTASDTTNILASSAASFNASTRLLRYTFPQALAASRAVSIIAADSAGNRARYRFLALLAPENKVPSWAASAVWYQIFPERFRNGDRTNDPTRESLELGNGVPDSWRVKEWGGDWFARDDWERAMSTNFYSNAIFHRRYGGDLQGIIDKLDYLRGLGVTALYLNPVFYANSLHKYDGNAHHHIDPYFGPNPKADLEQIARENASAAPYDPKTWRWTSADSLFLKLLQAAKQRGLRVIIDGVFNHTGRGFYAFQDLQKNQQQSRFRDWYVVTSYDDPATPQNEFRYKSWEGFESLPEFARSPDGASLADGPKQYIFDITKRWMDPNGDGNPSDGIDGWRLDVVPYMPIGFWNEWNAYVRRLNPQAYTTAEIWTDQTPATVRDGNFSAAMNYWAFLQPVKDFFIDGKGTAQDFWNTMQSRRNAYPPQVQAAMQNLMDSHDTERLASMIVNKNLAQQGFTRNAWGTPSYQIRKPTPQERDVQKLIALFQMTYVGAPMLYYGTESGLWGGNDPDDRSPMNWDDITFAPQAASHSPAFVRPVDDMNFDANLFQFYKSLRPQFFRDALLQRTITTQPPKILDVHSKVLALQWEYIERYNPNPIFYPDIVLNQAATMLLNTSSDTASFTLRGAFTESTKLPFGVSSYITTNSIKVSTTRNSSTGEFSAAYTLPPLSGGILYNPILVSAFEKNNILPFLPPRAYPQPFDDTTTLEYTLASPAQVQITLHDALGREVLRVDEGWKPQGAHVRLLHGEGLPSGAYTCSVQASTGAVQRVMLVKR